MNLNFIFSNTDTLTNMYLIVSHYSTSVNWKGLSGFALLEKADKINGMYCVRGKILSET
jgi:hypothetical protein